MGRKLADATKACRMRRTRGETWCGLARVGVVMFGATGCGLFRDKRCLVSCKTFWRSCVFQSSEQLELAASRRIRLPDRSTGVRR